MPRPLRVLAFAQYPDSQPSTRFRLGQFVSALRDRNVELSIHPFLRDEEYRIARRGGPRALGHLFAGFRDLDRAIASSRSHDVVLVQRNLAPIMDGRFLRRLEKQGIPLVYDFDDAVFLPLVGGRRWLELLRSPRATTEAFCRQAAVVLAGNEYLADFARAAAGSRHADRVRVLPSVIDTERFKPAPGRHDDVPVLGWVGSDTTLRYLESLAPVLRELRGETTFRLLVVAGDARPTLPGVDFEFATWSSESEVEVFGRLDVGLYPLEDTPWTQGKCGFKAIQYLACGVPCVVSPVGPLNEIVRHGGSGFHARESDDWVENCRTLLTDPELRARLGREGRQTVVERYSLASAVPTLLAALREAAASGDSSRNGGF